MARSVHSHHFTDINGNDLSLSAYQGKVLLLVNTASQCGFTGQYAGLQKLYETYQDKGLVVIGMPCNDFGQQEPACALDIKHFTAKKFSVTFPLTGKVHVKGATPHPFFVQVKKELGSIALPRWNFYKYVVGRDGYIKTWFTPLASAKSSRVVRAVEQELNK